MPAIESGFIVGQNRLVLEAEGQAQVHNLQDLLPYSNPQYYGSWYLSPDGTTLIYQSSRILLLFGVPTPARTAYSAIPVQVKPSSINVRQFPSVDAPVVGTAPEGLILANERNATGTYLYSEAYAGCIRADAAYIDTGTITIEVLPIRE